MEWKAKERREVGEGDDTVVVEDTSDDDDEDEETLQDRFQLRSRFSRPGLPLQESHCKSACTGWSS
jgi:hypothetical protein